MLLSVNIKKEKILNLYDQIENINVITHFFSFWILISHNDAHILKNIRQLRNLYS